MQWLLSKITLQLDNSTSRPIIQACVDLDGEHVAHVRGVSKRTTIVAASVMSPATLPVSYSIKLSFPYLHTFRIAGFPSLQVSVSKLIP